MNLKLNNDLKSTAQEERSRESVIKDEQTCKRYQQEEERRRTGRYIAILVGISLFLLALYHAWVRRIPVVASLVVPALIMFVYVAWVLYTASRDKHKKVISVLYSAVTHTTLQTQSSTYVSLLHGASSGVRSIQEYSYYSLSKFHLFDVEAGENTSPEPEGDIVHISELTQNNVEVSVVSNKDGANLNSSGEHNWTDISSALLKESNVRTENQLTLPIILVNDKPPEDLDLKWLNIELANSEKFKCFYSRRKFKRRFCRSRRSAVFKRSYSIA